MVKKFLFRVLCGFFLGISVFAPGFSGSIIAIILGIYHDIVRITANPFKKLKENIIFCIPLGIGVAISAVFFIFTFRFLFDNYEKATYFLFVGLICGNIPEIWSEMKKTTFKIQNAFGGAIAFVLVLVMGVLSFSFGGNDTGEITSNLFRFGLGGFFGGVVLLVPGMSVSAVLFLAGIYEDLIYIVNDFMAFDFTYIVSFAVFAFTALIGVVLASNGIKILFEKHPGIANTSVFGFIVGSLISVVATSIMLKADDSTWGISILMLTIGLAISFLFVILGRYLRKDSEEIVEVSASDD